MPTTQQFQFLTRNGKIAIFRPHNPFAPGIVERINAHPLDQQLQVLNEVLVGGGAGAQLEVLGINADYDVVLYSLSITVP